MKPSEYLDKINSTPKYGTVNVFNNISDKELEELDKRFIDNKEISSDDFVKYRRDILKEKKAQLLKEIDKEWDEHIKEFPDSRRALEFKERIEKKVEEILRWK